ncbi:MAG: hypothetical protein KGN34_14210 [Sphingomonadales bacterium]|nr:hypothetical protein [Sphingomonadales bacterium]
MDKTNFIREWKRMRLYVAAFTVLMFALAVLHPAYIPILFTVFLPIWSVILWRWRCWNCGERLMTAGGAFLQMDASGPVKHKSCGADLR